VDTSHELILFWGDRDSSQIGGKFLNSTCRICQSTDIQVFVDFGNLAMTGFFPAKSEHVNVAPLALGKCQQCGLVQLRDKLPIEELYAPGYGYESHLNSTMKSHLQETAQFLERLAGITTGDVILDIASNDGTMLSGYSGSGFKLIGIDPLIPFLTDNYPSAAIKVKNFFSFEAYTSQTKQKAKLVTSFSVFYDLDNPRDFASDVCKVLSEDGLWVLEQSYLPSMVRVLGFDTICHEHLLYLSLNDVHRICSEVGLEILDFRLNEVNGGSIQIFIQKAMGPRIPAPHIAISLEKERNSRLISNEGLIDFGREINKYKNNLKDVISSFKERGFEIQGLGASTKGNVLLQVCGLDSDIVTSIGEVNPKKFGLTTPGSLIPIVDEREIFAKSTKPKLILVFPWHFRDSILKKFQKSFLEDSFLLFPLPFEPTLIGTYAKTL
jgi:hypothetical protein